MKIADYVSKYLKESYDEPKGIENEDEAKKAIEDLKDFFEMGEDEDNEFGDDLNKMLMSMEDGEEVDDDLDFDADDFYEGKDSKKDCPECEATEDGKYCADCGDKKEGVKEEGKDWEDMTPQEQRRQERHSVKEEGYGREGYKVGGDDRDNEERSRGHSDGYDDDDDDKYDEDGIPKYPDPMRGRTRPGQRRLYSSKNYNMSVMEKKLEEYRKGKKNKKGGYTGDPSDSSSDGE